VCEKPSTWRRRFRTRLARPIAGSNPWLQFFQYANLISFDIRISSSSLRSISSDIKNMDGGHHEQLSQSLQELHLRQSQEQEDTAALGQQQQQQLPTDRSDGKADSEPSVRAPLHPDGFQVQLPPPVPRQPREGYGFRPQSGASTPLSPGAASTGTPIADPNGLGWPGKQCHYTPSHASRVFAYRLREAHPSLSWSSLYPRSRS
jgi:hypothetical protein